MTDVASSLLHNRLPATSTSWAAVLATSTGSVTDGEPKKAPVAPEAQNLMRYLDGLAASPHVLDEERREFERLLKKKHAKPRGRSAALYRQRQQEQQQQQQSPQDHHPDRLDRSVEAPESTTASGAVEYGERKGRSRPTSSELKAGKRKRRRTTTEQPDDRPPELSPLALAPLSRSSSGSVGPGGIDSVGSSSSSSSSALPPPPDRPQRSPPHGATTTTYPHYHHHPYYHQEGIGRVPGPPPAPRTPLGSSVPSLPPEWQLMSGWNPQGLGHLYHQQQHHPAAFPSGIILAEASEPGSSSREEQELPRGLAVLPVRHLPHQQAPLPWSSASAHETVAPILRMRPSQASHLRQHHLSHNALHSPPYHPTAPVHQQLVLPPPYLYSGNHPLGVSVPTPPQVHHLPLPTQGAAIVAPGVGTKAQQRKYI